MERYGDLLRTSSLDLVAVSYLSSNAESFVRGWLGASLAGDDSLARFLIVHTMLEVMGLVVVSIVNVRGSDNFIYYE